MDDRKAFFRKLHPEQFSDSTTVKMGSLDRDFFDYYLDSLTSKGLERQFEVFCRRIAEVEICPNLLPQTGPTGGGDSKVDSETYPVAETLAANWYFGIGNSAASERWAFAFSAKKDWKSKVVTDVNKIIAVNDQENRRYTKIFFISNQYISDKKRADTEDGLRKGRVIDTRILDRTWLLDKVFSSQRNKNIAIECFSLSDSFKDEIATGINDYKRQQEFAEIESKLADDSLKIAERLSLLERSVVLARELEYPKDRTLGLICRYKTAAQRLGHLNDVADSIYCAAWTIYWWYPDPDYYYELYLEYERIAMQNDNVNYFTNLVTLWINLFIMMKKSS